MSELVEMIEDYWLGAGRAEDCTMMWTLAKDAQAKGIWDNSCRLHSGGRSHRQWVNAWADIFIVASETLKEG